MLVRLLYLSAVEGLPGTYFLLEEEVPRAGAVVSHSYQRAHWVGGAVFTWLGARKQTGRGEGWGCWC
jgi:hypothetical protein